MILNFCNFATRITVGTGAVTITVNAVTQTPTHIVTAKDFPARTITGIATTFFDFVIFVHSHSFRLTFGGL
jgi:hypothetical protein